MEIVPFLFFLIFIVVTIFTFLIGFVYGKKVGVVVGLISPFLIFLLYYFFFSQYYHSNFSSIIILITGMYGMGCGYLSGRYSEMRKIISEKQKNEIYDDDKNTPDDELERTKKSLEEKILSRTIELTNEIEIRKKFEEKLKAISELISDFSYSVVINNENRIDVEWVDDKYFEKTGYTYNDFGNVDWKTLIHPDDINDITIFLEKIFHGVAAEIDMRIKTKSGMFIWVRNFSKPDLSLGNNSIRIIGACTDITFQKQIEEKLTESEKKFRRLFVNNPLPMFIFDRTSLGILEVNKTALQKYGYQKNEILKMNVLQLFPISEKISFQAWLASGKAWESKRTYKQKLYDGSIIETKILIDSFEIENKEVYLLMPIDISENIKLEHENLLLANSLRSIKECVSITDEHDILIYVNETFCSTYGYSEEEIIGKNINIVRPKSNVHSGTKEILTATKKNGFKGELYNLKKDGTEFPIYLTTATVKNEKDEVLAYIGVANDISEIKKYRDDLKKYNEELKKLNYKLNASEQELKELNSNKDKFFSIIAHDLKNPFTALLGISEQLSINIESFSTEEIQRYTKNIYDSSKNLYALLENLLQWSRLQTNRIKIEPSIINLSSVVSNVVNILLPSAQSKEIEISVDVQPDLEVFANIDSVNSILQNLIANAIKFTHNKGSVNIIAVKEGNYASIKIIDNGVGIEQERLINLFKLEVQQSTKGTNNETGSGLGLLLCKELIEKNKGRLKVSSEVGKGSTFSFLLPATSN